MRVLMIPSWYPAGPGDVMGSFFREQAVALSGAGDEVGVLAPRLLSWPDVPGWARAHTAGHPRWAVEDGVVVGRLDLLQVVPRARTLEAALATGWHGPVARAADGYARRCGRPDLLHAHSLYPGAYLAQRLAARWGIPWVYTEHRSLDHLREITPMGLAREAHVASAASVRLAVSRGHARHLADRLGPRAGSWQVLPNLVADRGQSPHRHAPGSGPVVGHLSSLTAVKRPDLVVEVFSRVLGQDPTARLRLAGPVAAGPAGRRLRALVAAGPASGRIELVGEVPRRDVGPFLAGLDVLLQPSDSETFGIVLAESLAQGTPVVSTRTWGAEDVVAEGDGALADVGDAAGLAHALRRVLDEGDGGAPGRARRRGRCLDRFGREAFVTGSRAVYREALG